MCTLLNIIVVGLIGALFGVAELLQRYSDTKYTFMKRGNMSLSVTYIAINIFVSVIALLVIEYAKGNKELEFSTLEFANILIAGLGGMMILRSYLFSYKLKDKQVEIGLSAIIQIFLNHIDKRISQNSAKERVDTIAEIMRDVNFDIAKDELYTLCISFIDNFTSEDMAELTKRIKDIEGYDVSNKNKSMQLGRAIACYCGEDVLTKGIKQLSDIVKITGEEHNDSIDNKIDLLKNSKL